MLNLFQHLTASLYLPPFLGEILKQVQDDFGRYLLFIFSFWAAQFNILCKKNCNFAIKEQAKHIYYETKDIICTIGFRGRTTYVLMQ